MKILKFFFTLFLFIPALVSARDWQSSADKFLGGIYYSVTGQTCSKADYNEYDFAVCNLNYRHLNYQAFQKETSSDFFEDLTNEVVFNSAASQIYEMNKCQADFFNLYESNLAEKTDLESRAFSQFEHVKKAVATSDKNIKSESSVLISEISTAPCADSTSCAPFAMEADERYAKKTSPIIDKLNILVRSIPMGNRPEMREYLVEASQKNLSEQQFKSGYNDVMKKLKLQADQSYSQIKEKTYPDPDGKGLVFKVRKNDEGAGEFRRSLISNGLVQNTLLQHNMEDRMKNGFMCRLHQSEAGRNIRFATEIAASFLVPYAAATLSLRAGLIAASTGSKIVRTTAVATEAFMPAVLFGTGFTEGLINSRDAFEACTPPEYLTSKKYDGCNAEKQMYEVKTEASIASCVLSVGMGIVLPVSAIKLATKSDEAIEVMEEIVVTAPVEKYGKVKVSTQEENLRFKEVAGSTRHQEGTLFVDTQNSMLKWLNDNLKDKGLVDALNNRHSLMLEESITELRKKYPELKLEKYSDYKGIRLSVTVPATKEAKLQKDLERITAQVDRKFQDELAGGNYLSVTGRAREERWFSTGVGGTSDLANIQARFPPGTSWKKIEETWTNIRSKRQALEAKFGNSPLMRKVNGEVSSKIPTSEVFELLRKNSDNSDLAAILNHRHGLSINAQDIELFRSYAKEADLFSPGLLVTERVSHNFDEASFGGVTLDFGGVGSLNAEATAEGLAQGFSLKRSVINIRQNEKNVTTYLDQVKEKTTVAVRDALARHGITAKITVSGDDMVVIPDKILSDNIKAEILQAQSKAQAELTKETGRNTNVRVSYFKDAIKETEDRAILAAEGEGIEKILRTRLEFKLTQRELKGLTLSTDMLGSTRGTGGVRLLTNNTLSSTQQALVQKEFEESVRIANLKYGSSFKLSEQQ